MSMGKSKRRLFYGGSVTGVAVLMAAVYLLGGSATAGADFDPAAMATVVRGTMTRSVVATGKIEPITKVEVKSKANGIIEALRVDVGDVITPGQVLVELDKETLAARLREARANLQAATAGLSGAEAALEKNIVEAEGPDVQFARRSFERAKALHRDKLLAQSGLDDAQSALEVAENRQRSAKSQLVVARAKVAEADANVAQSRAAVERAEEELRNATIRSPLRGMVLTRDVEVGSPVSSILNMGSAASLVMTVGDIERVFVRGKVDEADVGRVRLGQPARISVETFKERTFEGKVTQISPIGVEKDNVTTFEVEVSIENPGSALKANMTANAEIVLEEHPNVLIVPEAAIVYDAGKNPFVDVPDSAADNGRRRVAVKLGVGSGTKTEVVSGLKAGDRVLLPR
jgi:HlyD family secretion protein